MNCKHCQAELADEELICPACGKSQEEPVEETASVAQEQPAEEATLEQEQPKAAAPEIQPGIRMTPGKLALVIGAVVVLLAVLVAAVIHGIDSSKLPQTPSSATEPAQETLGADTAETEDATQATVDYITEVEPGTDYPTYTVTDEQAQAAIHDVVATLGDAQLTNGELQVYYWMEVIAFLQEYGSYAEYFGMDIYLGLDAQVCPMNEEPMTWEQFFLEEGLSAWKLYQSMSLEADEEGYQLSADAQAELDSVPAELDEMAEWYGFADAEELLASNVGPGSSIECYLNYMKVCYRGSDFYETLVSRIQPTQEELEAYYEENKATYEESGVTLDTVSTMNVRHILLQPTATGEDGAYTDEDWENCRQEAQALLDQWLAGEATEDSFAALANEYSTDPGSNTNGGLYEGVYVGQMVEPFENWCFDESRQIGDSGLVLTDYGYHIMYYVKGVSTVENDLISEKTSDLVPAALEKYAFDVNYDAIKLGYLSLVG